jgi:hypothetical protein
MGVMFRDRTAQTSTTTGTGSYSLNGSVTGFQDFDSVGNGNECFYAARMGAAWEVGRGTLTVGVPNTLTRDEIFDSSDDGDPIDWTAGTKSIALVVPAHIAQAGRYYAITDEEVAAGYIPTNYEFAPGDYRRFGGDPTGVEDSAVALNKALATCLDNPIAGTCRVTTPGICRDYQHIYGLGADAAIVNDAESVGGSGQCLVLGTYDDGGATDSAVTYYALENVTFGDPSVECSTPAHAANFTDGDTVYIWSGTEGYLTTSSPGYWKPAHLQISEVIDVDAGTGIIKLRDPVFRTTTGMRISKFGASTGHAGNDFTPQGVKYVTINNLTLNSVNDAWSRYGGLYRCLFDSLVIYGRNVWAMNIAGHCQMTRIRGTTTIRTVEFGYGCHDNFIDDIISAMHPDAAPTQDLGVVSFGEGSRNNRVCNVTADYRDAAVNASCVKMGQGSWNNHVENLKVRATSLQHLVRVNNTEDANVDFGMNRITGGVWQVDSVDLDAIDIFLDDETCRVGLEIVGVKLVVDTLGAKMLDVHGVDFALRDCDLKDTPAATNTINAGATQVRFVGNRFPAGTDFGFLEQANLIAQGNTVTGREVIERPLRLEYATPETLITSTTSTNQLAAATVPGGILKKRDTFEYELGGLKAGVHEGFVQIVYDGDIVMAYSLTAAGNFYLRGSITVIGASVDAWRANGIHGSVTNASPEVATSRVYHKVTSSVTTSDGVLEIRCYVANAASSIQLEVARLKHVPRY